jgi:hypothetical protein
MAHQFKAPAENNNGLPDMLNPVEIAKFTVQKSLEGLRFLLGIKKDRMASLKPSGNRDKEVLAVANESVMNRLKLVESMA